MARLWNDLVELVADPLRVADAPGLLGAERVADSEPAEEAEDLERLSAPAGVGDTCFAEVFGRARAAGEVEQSPQIPRLVIAQEFQRLDEDVVLAEQFLIAADETVVVEKLEPAQGRPAAGSLPVPMNCLSEYTPPLRTNWR